MSNAVNAEKKLNLFGCEQSSVSLTRYIIGETRWKKFDKVKVSMKKGSHGKFIYYKLVSIIIAHWFCTVIADLSLRMPSIVLLPLAVIPSAIYTFWGASRRSVLLTDVLALSFSHNALSLLKLDSFKTGSILLSGLFVYDVWWVFGTDVVSRGNSMW